MKKVLSVLLAAAMVMGMSVSAMAAETADKVWGKGPKDIDVDTPVTELTFFDWMHVEYTDGTNDDVHMSTPEDEFVFHPGDVAYFRIMDNNGAYTAPIDKDWAIYIKDHSSYIKSAEFAVSPDCAADKHTIATDNCAKFVKITFQAAYDELDIDDVDFYFYIADTSVNLHVKNDKSKSAEVHYLFDNWMIEYVDYDFLNDVDTMTKWVTREGKAGKGTAAFNFNKEAYVVVKMNPEEEVIFNYSSAYDKALDKLAGYDADLSFYNFKGTKDNFNRVADLVIPADDESFIYAVVDGKFAEVEATYAEDYEVIKGTKVDGWVIETNELGYYVVSDIELEIEAEEVEAEPEVEAEKANPETGAADFVGAAVAMAVVSVAAAGALALKK